MNWFRLPLFIKIKFLLLLAIFAVSCSSTKRFKRHPVIAKTPVIKTIKAGTLKFAIRGYYMPDYAKKKILPIANSVITDVIKRFKLKTKNASDKIIDLYLCKDVKEYVSILQATGLGSYQDTMGMYVPQMRLILADIGISIGNLMHELVHPLLTSDFPEIPLWMNEGIATLYGKAIVNKKGVSFLNNFRIHHVRKAIINKALPSLKQLANCKPFVISIKNPVIYYSLSRCLMLYLDRMKKLSYFYVDMRAAGFDKIKHEKILKKHVDYNKFKRWISRQKF